jgi:hypothetical protein
MDTKLCVIIVEKLGTPHLIAVQILVLKGLMGWVPKQYTYFTNPKDPTYVGELNLT